jgi:hypothetical protein
MGCPPFVVDVTGWLKAGDSTLRIDVDNTAVNYLAKAGFPNYNLAGRRQAYRNCFAARNSNPLTQPLPSGLIEPSTLEPREWRFTVLRPARSSPA